MTEFTSKTSFSVWRLAAGLADQLKMPVVEGVRVDDAGLSSLLAGPSEVLLDPRARAHTA